MNNRERKKVDRSTLVLASGLMFVLGYFGGTRNIDIRNLIAPVFGWNKIQSIDLSKVENTYETLAAKFDGELDLNKLVEGASKGLVEAAGDDYTEYLTKEEAEEFNKSLSGDVGIGIGVELAKRNNAATIVRILKNNPAEKSGLQAGDIIVAVNDEDVTSKTIAEITKLIKGDEGTTVKIKVSRNGETKEFSIQRAKIENPSVELSVSENIATLTVSRFDSETGALAKKYAEEIKEKGISKVILDLRGNGGGYVTAAQSVASLWLEKNAVIVTEKKGSTTIDEIKASGNNILKGAETVVLVDGSSASASEIVTGALKHYKAATIIGEKTFGKGSVQEPVNINGESILKITVAKWYTPDGQNISKNGISPDKEIKNTEEDFNAGRDPQLDYAKETLK